MGSTCFELSEIRGCVCSPVGEVCNNKTSEHAELKLTLREGSARSILSLFSCRKAGAPASFLLFPLLMHTTLLYGQESKKGVRALSSVSSSPLLLSDWPQPKLFFGSQVKERLRAWQDLWRHLPNAKRERVKKILLYYYILQWILLLQALLLWKGTRQFSNQPFPTTLSFVLLTSLFALCLLYT